MLLKQLEKKDWDLFITLNQESFQKGFEDYFGKTNDIIIPKEDIINSLNAIGSQAFLAYENNEVVGGVCVVIDTNTNMNHLDILFVKAGIESKGIGFKIWKLIENMYPTTKVWYTCTPYFDKRNIHFYVNKCGFHITKYITRYSNNELPDNFIGDNGEGMFEFEKIIK